MTLINEGGPFFMISLIILFLLIIFLLVKSFITNSDKNLELLKSISLFALVFGFFGFIIGLISALDVIEGDVNPSILARGIKRGLLSPTIGSLIFLIGRLGVVLLIWIKKSK